MLFPRSRILLVSTTLLSAAVLTLSLSILMLSPERIARRMWKKYYTLHIEKSETAEQLILQILESRRFEAVVSRYTSQTSFNTFDGFVSVPIHRVADRLDPLDPRFDPYMQRLGKLFSIDSGRSWEVVYLLSDRNPLSTYLALREILRVANLKWRLIEFEPSRAVLQVLLCILYLSILVFKGSDGSIRSAILLAALTRSRLTVSSSSPIPSAKPLAML